MISRPFLSSIAFRLPFAIVFICILVFSLAAIAIYGLQRARQEMAAYGLQAFSSLAKASLVSRQVSDLVSSAPFLMNATSPYRVSSESRSVVVQVDALIRAMEPENGEVAAKGFGSGRIVELLETIRTQTTALADDAESAQQHKAEAAAALGEIATGSGIADVEFRGRLNAIVQAASNSDSLFQLGELRRRYVSETAPRLQPGAPDIRIAAAELAPYERIFDAQTQYLLEMFAIRSAVSRLHNVSRDLSHATETQSETVARSLSDDLVSTSDALSRILVIVAVASLLVLAMAVVSIRSVMRVSRGIVSLSNGMNALAEGRKDVDAPRYDGTETELVRLLEAFRAFRESVERVTRLRRTAEAAARTIRSTFRSMNEGIALFDPRGRPITMNRRVIALLGWSGSARKLPLRSFVMPLPEIDLALLPAENDPGLLADRYVLRHRADAGRVTEVSLSRQPDGGIVLLARDITEIDRQETEAAKIQRLDGIMRMTHQVSHEVGNMIGIITGSLGLLERETGFNDRQKRHLARIRKAADRGRSLAGSMLSIGSQQPIHPSEVELGSVLRGMADVLEIAIGEKCRLDFEIADDLPMTFIDTALFEQSILNLCLNSAAAMPAGGTIHIRCARSEAGMTVSVTDDGIGMTPEAVDKAFEPYFTTRDAQGGAGLGLAIVYGFVRQSGGDARITSLPGKGTVVELWFPG
ncbi:sensor histidine kinase protein (plasmid) [Rhizobium phaseoli]|uniref:histidine kinase n=1 Tax=Rhizobium phaseoli TaxID=396 RepID=A0ABM6CHX8_9HYPH|nr:ATP-binding protein [Rhizobium phaseoli]ANL68609.1 sensor histidine kinase protein [Rhizobium phaseoli]ANL81418.1 sensor histidine kinase protein [Rhizobium phaseoli]ANL87905.1 sensor histidine kinase protein [Rhizobium phaseoli]ANL94414.1 sensor histidine kinase protein [Rhizobium phaseoli]